MDSKSFYKNDAASDDEPIGLRPAEAAARLGVSETTLYRLRMAGRIPFVKLDGAVIYRVASLDKFLLEFEQRNKQDTARADVQLAEEFPKPPFIGEPLWHRCVRIQENGE